jgi:hypothetical protein
VHACVYRVNARMCMSICICTVFLKKFTKSFGLKVTVFSTSDSKRDEAINLLGADNFVISSNDGGNVNCTVSITSMIVPC